MKHKGFTLIEVLIALTILAIALVALLQSMTMSVQISHRLDEKREKHWVAMQALSNIQLHVIPLKQGETISSTTHLLGQTWYWRAQSKLTFIKTMDEITITVSPNKTGPFTDALLGFRHE